MSVVIETTIGDITVDLYVKERPNTCLNFLKLCKIKFYNLCVFYKIEKNFIAQTGDPTATGRGGESVFCRLYGDQAKYFDAEFKPRLKHEKVGTLSMVNNGNNMNGSQFFLTLSKNLTYLDENHTVFGEVAEGFDVLLKLNDAICDNNNRPYQDIRITHTVILHDPFEDPKGLEIPDASPEPTKAMLESDYIGADEEIDDTKGKTAEEVEEKIKESEAKARATILEMVGDIPDAEVKPPENVLFVCKLNPVTTSEDLEVIFSRFGKILSCEVIKDKKTGESLQYAFIEFEREEDCEAAYFKMDNVLIDDRRIHVDFSQSVSKLYFNRNNPINKKQAKSNIVLKNSGKNDGYDLIFDDDDDDANNPNFKSKCNELPSKHKNSSNKRKPSTSGNDHEEKRKIGMERKEHTHSYKDSKNYRYDSEKEKNRYKEKQQGSRRNEYSHESEKSKNYNLKEDKYIHYDKHRELSKDRSEKSDKRYERDQYSYSAKKNFDYRSQNRYSTDDLNRNRDSKSYRKSDDSYRRERKFSHERIRERSLSPDQSKKSYKNKEQSSEYFSHKKHINRSDSEESIDCNKRSKYKSKKIGKEKIQSASQKQKKDKVKKHRSSNKSKSKRSRSSSISSSSSTVSSSSSSSSSSSTSSSNKISDQSPISSYSKHHAMHKKDRNSSKKTKSHKKMKY